YYQQSSADQEITLAESCYFQLPYRVAGSENDGRQQHRTQLFSGIAGKAVHGSRIRSFQYLQISSGRFHSQTHASESAAGQKSATEIRGYVVGSHQALETEHLEFNLESDIIYKFCMCIMPDSVKETKIESGVENIIVLEPDFQIKTIQFFKFELMIAYILEITDDAFVKNINTGRFLS